ncbi:hypothetical protein MJN85_30570, partial [Salmonella enterica subsp. enterica serovar Anatum]|nr:hypothetical protein [Salmonella enterica subsp. enterica serovar Anatum]
VAVVHCSLQDILAYLLSTLRKSVITGFHHCHNLSQTRLDSRVGRSPIDAAFFFTKVSDKKNQHRIDT